ncbi:MAG TPA: ATP-dependent 6-phosphofructokinase [Anaerolineaceae bacterium]|nr:ATP-dependent 6-phosphofructokinase [Anaerolineaceae bacterium]HPN52752.1 ATP-dependent 6-phosphofructokinase [Anaerolineaceae bacterium]
MTKLIGILTAGGDTPGLNAALRGLGKAAIEAFDMQVIGFFDGFRGLMENRTIRLDESNLSGILTRGGTILGTSRDKPNSMPLGGQLLDMTDTMVENYHKYHLDALVCLGGGGTQKSAYRLMKKGLNILTLPKTIDNDVDFTDVTFGFDTALGIATEAVDRLHSTAHSHHRIIVVEVMGHNAGWLALGAGIAGGADVILIPEIPYNIQKVADAILKRSQGGKRFSIVAVSEGALSIEDSAMIQEAEQTLLNAKKKSQKEAATNRLLELQQLRTSRTMRLASELERLTGLESRVTILGYLQRGGTPSAADRLLATRLGTAAAELIYKEKFGVMVAARGETTQPVELERVVNRRRLVPLDHSWITSARRVGTSLGD